MKITNLIYFICIIINVGIGVLISYLCFEFGKQAGKLEYLEYEHEALNFDWLKEQQLRRYMEIEMNIQK
jgi:hypothetical protein